MSYRARRSRSPRSRGRHSRSPTRRKKGQRRRRHANTKRDSDGIYWYQDCTERESHRRRKVKNENKLSEASGGSKSSGYNSSNKSGSNRTSKGNDGSNITGDEHIDREGIVSERSNKYHEMMSETQYSAKGSGEANDGIGDIFGMLHVPKKKKKHRMERKAWNTVATKGVPSSATDLSRDPIGSKLYLEHVHGFRGQDVRNNLYYAADGTMVYIAAALGICVDPKTGKQRYMGEHTDDILSIALTHQSNKFSYVATGEIGRNPKIIVWKSNTMEIISTIQDCHKRGICRVAFSPSGSILASIGIDDQNSLALHDWQSGDQLRRMRTGGDKVFGLAFHPDDDNVLVSCGHNHITFWTQTNRGLDDVNGTFGGIEKLSVLDTVFDGTGRCIAATSLGHLCVFSATSKKTKKMLPFGSGSIKNAHGDGKVNCVEVVLGGKHIVSGGSDGRIRVWDCSSDEITKVNEFKFPAQIPSVQSLSVLGMLDDAACKALVGTRGGDVLEISLHNGKRLNNKPIITGHHFGELWGLVCHPTNPDIFVTSGDDKTCRMWNIGGQECVAIAKSGVLPDMSRCLAYTTDGTFLACGCGGRLGSRKVGKTSKHTGKVVILDGTSLRHLSTFKVAKEQISDLCYSNDGKTLV
jgi:echinoderm microtubule-associated protein-like 6